MTRTRSILLGNKKVDYTLQKKRGQRTIALSIHSNGKVTVTTPKFVSIRSVEVFLQEKSNWVAEALQGLPLYTHEKVAHQKKLYLKHRETARKIITRRLTELNQHYNQRYFRVTMRNNTSRWGSCSQAGYLNFDYRVAYLPSHLRDYVLVHELCHLQEMNHGKRFWSLVEQTTPNYKEHRVELAQIQKESVSS